MVKLDHRKITGLAFIPFYIVITAILVVLNIHTVFESPFLLLVLNSLFIGLIPLLIAFIAFRTFRTGGSTSVLLMGSGMIIFGLGSIFAAMVTFLPNAPNNNVTIYNTCVCVGSIFFLIGSLTNIAGLTYGKKEGSIIAVGALYGGIFAFAALFSLAVLQGIVPPFFIQEVGPTALRQIILSTAIEFYVISSVLLMYSFTMK
jgi:hypothetical protein